MGLFERWKLFLHIIKYNFMRKKCSNFIFRKVSKFKYLAHKTMFLLEIKSARKGYMYLNCLMYRHLKCLIYMLRCFRLIFISFFVIFNPTRKLLVCFIIIMSLSLSWVLLVLLCDFNIDSIAQNQRTIHLKTNMEKKIMNRVSKIDIQLQI